ncbi:protein-L-isoaspartate(D-aspartate) O-methyltransferase [Salicibibacter halophilus]|uniref:Protein-L-isoaspartate O-methyltransferase n=1 Tax=Salicibibacter halophilus TaxID=2502791 RepID=A0A514LE07_9BACI|nr:protein-L-isoaspartate(D-aspartate) O-methyltransferase [Salicibibacter halophilus]QDI90079.1 protein-L-isoaspartate(D-aspartate) O-methyltransferase [Salicibibacter halophilus]
MDLLFRKGVNRLHNQEKEINRYFEQMDRSYFIDENKELASLDQALSIGYGQTISQPTLVLKMTLELGLSPESRVLEIGTGSGFQTALLAAFSDTVYTVEHIKALHERAKEKLQEAEFTNIHFKQGNGSRGWREKAPFDRIMVTAAAPEIPEQLLEQLKNGGKMIIPIGGPHNQDLTLIEKDEEGEITSTFIMPVVFVGLIGGED